MEDLDVNVGETPRFAVVVEGKPIPDILWYKVCFIVGFKGLLRLKSDFDPDLEVKSHQPLSHLLISD